MARLIVTTREGQEVVVPAANGLSVMELAREGGVDEIQALCGGNCSCATCHIYIESEVTSFLPPMSDDEDDLLDSSSSRQPNSRLSCQIIYSQSLDGLRVKVAPEG